MNSTREKNKVCLVLKSSSKQINMTEWRNYKGWGHKNGFSAPKQGHGLQKYPAVCVSSVTLSSSSSSVGEDDEDEDGGVGNALLET